MQRSLRCPRGLGRPNEQELSTSGFTVPLASLFAQVASPSQAPSSFVLEASSAPWLLVTVEDVPPIEPPSQAYKLVPQYLVQAEPGYSGATVKTLVAHHPVHQGGLSGSMAALTVVSSVGSTSFDELAYENNGQLRLIVAGCSASCYDSNLTTIVQIGTASESARRPNKVVDNGTCRRGTVPKRHFSCCDLHAVVSGCFCSSTSRPWAPLPLALSPRCAGRPVNSTSPVRVQRGSQTI
jgi:hypothetical protein